MDAGGWDERYGSVDLVWGLEPNRFVREHCEGLAAGTALDLGCGEGRNALWLAREGWRVAGVDFSAVAIERARRLATNLPADTQSRLTWLVQDVTTYEPSPGSLDLALACYVHLPAEQRDPMLRRAIAALRPGGRLLVVGHDRRNLAEGVSGPQDITLLYDPDSLRALARECGLDVEVAATVERPTDEGVALDTLLRARRS